MDNRCTAITKSGEKCRNFRLHGENKCITHSQSPIARKARKRRKILTREDMILELQRRLRIIKRLEGEDLEVTREIRMLISQIAELQGITPASGEEEKGQGQQVGQKGQRKQTFDEIVEEEVAKEQEEEERKKMGKTEEEEIQ